MGIFQPNARHRRSNERGKIEPAFIIYNLEHAEAALAAASAAKCRVTLLSPLDGAFFLGQEIFFEIIEEAAKRYPTAKFNAVLNCADEIGIALEAIRAGVKCISYQGNGEVLSKLSDIANQNDVKLIDLPQEYVDLITVDDPTELTSRLCKSIL